MTDFDAYPEEFSELIATAFNTMDALSDRLKNGNITPGEWFERMMLIIERTHSQAAMIGAGVSELSPEMQLAIDGHLEIQSEFLKNFLSDYQENGWKDSYHARSRMYALSSYASFNHGDVISQAGKVLPLPAYPAEGTQCLSNCKCSWSIDVLDFNAGNFDAYWKLGTNDSCQTCVQRAGEWSPVRIRGNTLL